jgi:hypothetical protein
LVQGPKPLSLCVSVAVAAAGEIAERTFPAGTAWTRELLDRQTRLALCFGFTGSGADHAVAVGISNKPEPRLLGVPDLEANPQMIFADTRRLILAKNFYQSPADR